MREVAFGAGASGIKQDHAKLQGGVIGDSKSPVAGDVRW